MWIGNRKREVCERIYEYFVQTLILVSIWKRTMRNPFMWNVLFQQIIRPTHSLFHHHLLPPVNPHFIVPSQKGLPNALTSTVLILLHCASFSFLACFLFKLVWNNCDFNVRNCSGWLKGLLTYLLTYLTYGKPMSGYIRCNLWPTNSWAHWPHSHVPRVIWKYCNVAMYRNDN
jgi:hypothetical protein